MQGNGDMEQAIAIDKRMQRVILNYLPQEKALEELTAFFSIFGDGTRLKILSALAISRLCVTEIAATLGINQTTVSHQLKILKSVGAVRTDRVGKVIFYSIADEKINEIMLWGVEYLGY